MNGTTLAITFSEDLGTAASLVKLRLHGEEGNFGDNSNTERNALDLGQHRDAHASHGGTATDTA